MSAEALRGGGPGYDVSLVRKDFPILQGSMRGQPLVFLDSAASAQKPRCVLDAIASLYEHDYANIHRGVYELSERTTLAYEEARAKLQRLIGAPEAREVIFVRGATEAINLVAASWGRSQLTEGDEIVVTEMEHHANLVPWQVLCRQTGARLRVAPITDEGELRLDAFEALLGPRTKLVAVTHVSNALGTLVPVREVTALAKRHGAAVLIDGAQAAPRLPVDVGEIGCDFYVFSGHKLYAPSGVGVLWGRAELLDAMPPYQTGGEMIARVTYEDATWNELPNKFEAGTPAIEAAIGLGAAVDYLGALGMEAIARHEDAVLRHGTELLEAIPGVRLVGTAPQKVGVLSFVIDGVHPHDIGTILDQEGVAIRAGHHCAMPLMGRLGLPATARASLGLYSDREDMERLAAALRKVIEVFA